MGEIIVLDPNIEEKVAVLIKILKERMDNLLKSGTNSIEDKDLPIIISSQITKLNELDQSVKKAMNAASRAKEAAAFAKTKSAGFLKKKEAIEELQSAGINLAEAVQFGVDAQKISFEFQTKLAEITKYLFGLGVSNIASNRFVVRELEMKLKGASKEKLSELARQELLSVIKQLKDQEDILKKQENISQYVKIHDEKLKKHNDKTQEITEQLKLHEEANMRLEEQMQAQAELNRLHSEQLQARSEVDAFHDEQIKLQAEKVIKFTEKLEAQEEVDRIQVEHLKAQDEIIKKCEEKIEKDHNKIKEQEIKINSMQDEINKLKVGLDTKANKTLLKITLGLAGLSFAILLPALISLILR